MPVLSKLQPQRVLHYFEEISAIPHGSGNTRAISDYCVSFAREFGLEVRQDEADNVVIIKPASAGYEEAPAIIVQGHLDMVCEKEPECPLDMAKEGLRLCTDGRFAWADGTTLGADDGIAVAMALALLEADDLPHPRLEVVLTSGEEIGMVGATALETDMLQGRLMLNVDSEVEGVLTVSCAGGVRASCHIPVEWEKADGLCLKLTIGGLCGGHSGMEIHKGFANSNILMARLLHRLCEKLPLRLAVLSGGKADNAIASSTEAVIFLPKEMLENAKKLTAVCADAFAEEYSKTEPDLYVGISAAVAPGMALTETATQNAVNALVALPNGVQSMSRDMQDLVQTSLNLGILRLEERQMVATFSLRSSLTAEKQDLCRKLEILMQSCGGTVTYTGDYPAWEYRKDSPLRKLVARVYREQTGKQPVIEAIHAGLECGVFAGKLPGLDCVSFGPDLLDIHTPREKMDLESVGRTWNLLKEVLKRAKELQ